LASAQTEFPGSRTIEHGLWEDPVVLVNSQGWVQHDLSIRGSSYTGSGISINGLNLKVPYSAHFNSELPFPGFLLSDPAAQYGLKNASGHLIGTVAYNTVPQAARLQVGTGIGTREHYTANASAFHSGVGGFIDWEKARRIDYGANNLDRYSGGAQFQHFVNDWQIDLMGAGQKKEFGAQGYYGIPSTVYAEQTTEDALFLLGATRGDLADSYFRTTAAWRQFDDEYWIPSTASGHDVRSRFGAAAIEGRTMEIQNIAVTLRGDIENEQVDGTTGNHDRTRGSVLILPEARFERFIVKAGLNSVFQTSEAAEFLPMAGIDWLATDNSTFYAAYSETIQQPDYQTLADNRNLRQQASKNTELGFRQFASASLDWRAAAFHRRLANASDWIGGDATGLGTLNIAGLESEISFYPSESLELRAFYQWVHKDNNRTDGLYELDYPEHLLAFSGHWSFTPEFLLFAAQTLRVQTENDARTSSNFGADASLGLHWFPRFAHSVRLSLLVDNLWGTNFQAIPGLKPPERTVSTGITVTW
jgi:outer membrane receptor protein involved in Fe transport